MKIIGLERKWTFGLDIPITSLEHKQKFGVDMQFLSRKTSEILDWLGQQVELESSYNWICTPGITSYGPQLWWFLKAKLSDSWEKEVKVQILA